MADPITSSEFYDTITDPTGTGSVVFNGRPLLKDPIIGANIAQIITNDALTTSSNPEQVLVSYCMLNELGPFQTFGSVDVLIQADVGDSIDGTTPLYCIQRKITKLLILFDNNTDWIQNPAILDEEVGEYIPVTTPKNVGYITEYANICSTGPGTATDYIGNYNIIVNQDTQSFDLVVTPATDNYIQYKIVSTGIVSNEYIWIDPIKREYLNSLGSTVNTTGSGDNTGDGSDSGDDGKVEEEEEEAVVVVVVVVVVE